jgi:hypothetical protein
VGSTQPYYRRCRPTAQDEADFLRDVSLRWLVQRLKGSGELPAAAGFSVRALLTLYPPAPQLYPPASPGSLRGLVANMLIQSGVSPHVDLESVHLDSYGVTDPVGVARALFDKRTAAVVFANVCLHLGVLVKSEIRWMPLDALAPVWPFRVNDDTGKVIHDPGEALSSLRTLLEFKFYGKTAPSVWHPTEKSLAAMAFADYFPGARGEKLREMVSSALLEASPGWCGTFGPGVGTFSLIEKFLEGNYDMAQQHLLRMAYAYFDELTPAAREHLVRHLLARGRIHRVNLKDTLTSGRAPGDWGRAGLVSPGGLKKRIGETENHVLTIHTARYLSNQLLYQRQPRIDYDNRRNSWDGGPTCMDLVLGLLRNILLDDFSEYNAKSYQHETRTALLNLCSFAYDHEVRLAARMVLDYVSAHMAVSGNDCRRMVPFRRRNEGKNVARTAGGRMTVGLLEWQRGADPMTEHMAVHTGATRAYRVPSEPHRPLAWSIASAGGNACYEMLSDYRMPAPIQDLFVNDLHRRFYQVLNRRQLDDIEVTGRNAVNSEIFAGSPSYLITAGGAPAPFAIDPYIAVYLPSGQDQQRGVALPSSFMPTGESAGNHPDDPDHATEGYAADATNLIQVGRFLQYGPGRNYGVAPDFLCGPYLSLPRWCSDAIQPAHRRGKFDFVNKRGPAGRPGFYLAILRDGDLAVVEAFDTWLHPDLCFNDFRDHVWARNQGLGEGGLRELDELTYTTENGNRIRFWMWPEHDDDEVPQVVAEIVSIEWSGADPTDRLPDAQSYRFLKGTVLNSVGNGVVKLTNPFLGQLGQTIELDMSDQRRPRRVSELNETEAAGSNQEVWVDFAWAGADASAGDFFRPFRSLAEAVSAVADHGVLKIEPGASTERGVLNHGKRLRLTAPIGGVRIGSHPPF